LRLLIEVVLFLSDVRPTPNRIAEILRFTVGATLEGKAETPKEYVIGAHLYGRNRQPDFHLWLTVILPQTQTISFRGAAETLDAFGCSRAVLNTGVPGRKSQPIAKTNDRACI
jgi:hypothetical protein